MLRPLDCPMVNGEITFSEFKTGVITAIEFGRKEATVSRQGSEEWVVASYDLPCLRVDLLRLRSLCSHVMTKLLLRLLPSVQAHIGQEIGGINKFKHLHPGSARPSTAPARRGRYEERNRGAATAVRKSLSAQSIARKHDSMHTPDLRAVRGASSAGPGHFGNLRSNASVVDFSPWSR
eukprot:SAG11_NODE_8927_length_961_cov_2.242459_1_plen_178_part_00